MLKVIKLGVRKSFTLWLSHTPIRLRIVARVAELLLLEDHYFTGKRGFLAHRTYVLTYTKKEKISSTIVPVNDTEQTHGQLLQIFGLWRVCFPPCLVRPGRRP